MLEIQIPSYLTQGEIEIIGVTDTGQVNATQYKDPRMKDVYDLSISTFKPGCK